MARIAQPFFVGDEIEIEDKAEAERMIAAGNVAPIKVEREIRVETADAQPVGVETTATHVAVTPDAGLRPARAGAAKVLTPHKKRG